MKQSATWSLQWDWPLPQPVWSFQSGSWFEHHLPQPYSHLDGTVIVEVQSGPEEVVEVVVVGVV